MGEREGEVSERKKIQGWEERNNRDRGRKREKVVTEGRIEWRKERKGGRDTGAYAGFFLKGGGLKSGPKYFAPENLKIAPAEKSLRGGGGGG